ATYNEDIDSLLQSAHFIFLSCPLTPETHHLLNKDRLNALRSDAIIINTGRGPLIDEAALANVLHSKRIAGVGLDVFEKEPEVHPDLLTAPNAVLLPHIGSATKETRREMGLLAARAIVDILKGKSPSEIPNLIS
ncbi:MAG: D-glycerate dehydrogenase, partial [Balneolales bacterium]|nr:D-glycerate dehydrogenase [Balneolales bacterium]